MHTHAYHHLSGLSQRSQAVCGKPVFPAETLQIQTWASKTDEKLMTRLWRFLSNPQQTFVSCHSLHIVHGTDQPCALSPLKPVLSFLPDRKSTPNTYTRTHTHTHTQVFPSCTAMTHFHDPSEDHPYTPKHTPASFC